jgi:hypothetical protein
VPAPDERFEAVAASLKKAVAALREGDVPYLLAGGLACWARGGPRSEKDLDFVVKPEDAQRALQALVDAGMTAEDPPEEWLLKAWDGDVLVDVIFEPHGLPVTDEVLARGDEIPVLAVTTHVMALEDVLATKLLALDEHRLDYSSLIRIARALREQIAWDDLRARTSDSPYAKAFFTLVEELALVEPAGQGERMRVGGARPRR